ncbi:MAG: extracellular solute-binding protein [Limnochordales bacterium]|nr:extracellular solute-binding protein [Limnochordales bacterium]
MNQPNFFSRRITRRELLSTGAKMAAGLSAVGAVGPLLRSLGGPSLASAQSNFTGQLSLLLGSHMEPVVKIAQLYEERYGVKPSVELVTTPDLEAKLSATFLARHSPWDASFATASLAASLASRGWLKNADRFINEKLRQGGQGQLLERALGGARFQGEFYAVPWTVGAPILHWNKRLFRERGLDPEAPATWHKTKNSWDTFVEYAKALTGVHNGQQIYGYTDAWAGTAVILTWGSLLQMHGGRFLDEEFQPVFNDEAGVEATVKMYDLLHTHKCVDPAVLTYTWVFDASPGYLAGRRGMFITWPFIAGLANAPDALDGDSGFAANPAVETSASVDGSEFLVVPAFARNEAEAWRFIELVTSREAQRIVALGGWAPIYGDLMDDPEILAAYPMYAAVKDSYQYPVDGGWSPDRPMWVEILSNQIHEVLAGRKKPKEALDDAVRLINMERF